MNKFIKKFLNNFEIINNYYSYLVDKTKQKEYVGITNEWLIDNFYLLVEHKSNMIHDKKEISKRIKNIDTIYNAVKSIVLENNYNINFEDLTSSLRQYQRQHKIYFSYKEIKSIKEILLFIYAERLCSLCKEEHSKLIDKDSIRKIIKDYEDKDIELSVFLKDGISIPKNRHYLFELNNQLKGLGAKNNKLFKELNELLEEKQISLKELINDEYQRRVENDILISNIFGDLKEFFEYSDEDLYKKTSKTEKMFMEDEIYSKMTPESKALYRKQLLKLAKKKKISEVECLDMLFEQTDRDDYHIGFQLFNRKSKSSNVVIYILVLSFLTILTSLFLCNYFISLKWLGFIILLIPVGQLYSQIINHILTRVVKPNVLPKLDFTKKGIPEDARTMVVIPTIVGNEAKIKEMFDVLETFYIINKSDNLYFTLLGDIKGGKEEVMPFDEVISKYGQEYATKLNKKYGKDLFYFIYRKRHWNEKEDQYLGYERKRGALVQFNQILLGKMDEKTNKKYFNVNMLYNKKLGVKYVITLDVDTRLVLNSALNLVGCMAHPMNRPVLNKAGTRVIKGYGLMQPRVSLDIEATNKSLYSQIFAGIGGFDTYSAVVPNVYQDSFGEGSFVGKGIYDLETFDKLLSNRFPDNLILSHDLLEGNYLRCGYVSDIEFIDDFPSKFLTDTSRQHRWARGDVQIISWLGNKVRNKSGEKEKNPISLLGKYKIMDNIIRMFLHPALLIILLCAVILDNVSPVLWIGFVLLEIAVPIIFFIRNILKREGKEKTTVYYKHVFFGSKSLLLRSYIVFATLPYYTKLYMDAFFRTIYRLTVSHKNLLNWITAEDAEKLIRGDLGGYIRNFVPNIVMSVILILITVFTGNYSALVLAVVFLSAPFVVYAVSCDIDHNRVELKDSKVEEIRELAKNTWMYFKDNLKEEYHYLIPDNYQENREQKLDLRASPTAIGFSLTSVVGAYELEFIDKDEAIHLLKEIIKTVDSLDKWNGHLYNWYDIPSKRVLPPGFVSTVDSGNFVASLIVAREFLEKFEEEDTVKLCDKLIKNTNFKKLYTKKDVFSIGYDEGEARLSVYNYNKFASESRLTSYLTICLGDAPSKHWFCLDKSLTTYKGHKGLISWSGTSFEYFMPLLFMKNYPNTLFDESYHFAKFCQKDFMESVSHKLPWGISESAYNELDNALNYKYKAFATPYLKAKEDKENRIVIAPYASLMAMELFPEEVYENIQKFKNLDMFGKYGMYEAYDYDNRGVVKAFFAHHQGMSLAGIVNYLKPDAIKNYFHENVNIKTFEVLLKEKVQVKTSIDLKMAKYKKYDYEKEKIENDIRYFDYLSYMPEVSVLSNKKYCLLMNDRGNSFSRYRTLQLNRYRKITEQDYGIFMYIKDLDSNYVWSNTYAPMNKMPDKYEVVFASDKIKYYRTDGDIKTKTEIVVTKNHHAEIRKITFKNNSDKPKRLQLTTYTEPILCENMADVSHRAFSNMFIHSDYDKKTNSLIVRRKSRGESNISSYMVNRLIVANPKEEYTYETERRRFVGRNRLVSDPRALNEKLSNYAGDNLDPVMSLRNTIEIAPNGSESVYLIVGFGRSREQIQDIIKTYNGEYAINKAFRFASLMNIINTKNMNVTGEDMRTYNIMLNYLYQTTKISVSDERMDYLRKNALGQNGLWKFGVSGDRPIISVEISDINDMHFVLDVLKAFEYYKNNSIFVDIVIINSESSQYAKIIKKEIEEEMYRMYTLNSFYHTPGSITVIDSNEITREERSLLNIVPRLRFVINNHETLKEAVLELQEKNKISDYSTSPIEETLPVLTPERLKFDNGFGGFKNSGREYVIYNKDTPAPWVNVIANKKFGTIITNNGCGFTYAYNSGEFKITSWTNEMIVNDKSEGFKFNGMTFDPTKCTHGFGYSILENETKDLKKEITEFVAVDDSVKIYLLKLTNKLDKKNDVDVSYFINPTFGNFEEKTARHILSEFMGDDNYMKLRNVYSINFGDVNVFMSSSEKIESAICDKILSKSIDTKVSLDANEEKTIAFVLGCGMSDRENLELIRKYTNVSNATKELKAVKDNWKNTLGTIEVKSDDKSFDYVVNGWYLYQALSSRIMAKAGFYQVSGAFGYRDQLQDSMNIAMIKPEITREQILTNAAHQFPEGDVLHWWHEKNKFGLRSRYKDDYLWLVYATIYYVDVTGDKSILYEEVPYLLGDKLSEYEHEKGITFSYSNERGTLLDHCIRSLQLSMNSLGKHKLPLMGGGDWNDGMNKVGIKGQGESVWLGFFLYEIISDFVKMMNKFDKKFNTEEYSKFNEKLSDALNKKAWDGEYYLRAYFDNGDKLGSHENSECKIDLISQSFSILSEVVPKDRLQQVINSVEENLVDNDSKIIKLLTPPFEKSLNNPGYIMNYPKGIRENGGQYTHAAAWYIMALIKAGYTDRAYKYYQMINPVNRSINEKLVNSYKTEPYVIAADIYSAEHHPGRGGWTWYTGSAGWFYRVGITEILGLKKNGDILRVVPAMPVAWEKYEVVYHYLDTTYEIEVVKSKKDSVVVDRRTQEEGYIKLENDGKTHKVVVHTR